MDIKFHGRSERLWFRCFRKEDTQRAPELVTRGPLSLRLIYATLSKRALVVLNAPAFGIHQGQVIIDCLLAHWRPRVCVKPCHHRFGFRLVIALLTTEPPP